jgi:hypothetical protein
MEFPSTCFSLLGTRSSLFSLEFSLDSSASCVALSIATSDLCFVLSPHLFSLPKPLCLILHHLNLTATPSSLCVQSLLHSLQVACTQDRLRAQICPPPSVSPTDTPHHLLPWVFLLFSAILRASLCLSRASRGSHMPKCGSNAPTCGYHAPISALQTTFSCHSLHRCSYFFGFFCCFSIDFFVFVFVFLSFFFSFFVEGLRRVKGPFKV